MHSKFLIFLSNDFTTRLVGKKNDVSLSDSTVRSDTNGSNDWPPVTDTVNTISMQTCVYVCVCVLYWTIARRDFVATRTRRVVEVSAFDAAPIRSLSDNNTGGGWTKGPKERKREREEQKTYNPERNDDDFGYSVRQKTNTSWQYTSAMLILVMSWSLI